MNHTTIKITGAPPAKRNLYLMAISAGKQSLWEFLADPAVTHTLQLSLKATQMWFLADYNKLFLESSPFRGVVQGTDLLRFEMRIQSSPSHI